MNVDPSTGRSRWTLAAWAIVVFGAGALAAYLMMGASRREGATVVTTPAPAVRLPAVAAPPPAVLESNEPLPDLVVPIPAAAAERAGLQMVTARSAVSASTLQLPATVEPNQYRQVTVTPLVGGRVTRVSAELGAAVTAGSTLAEIFSSDLADAQTKYLVMRAELHAADARLERSTRLVEIGAASQQELEQVRAERIRLATEAGGAAARLRLLGVSSRRIEGLTSPAEVSGTIAVPAPLAGVVTERAANIGLVVDPSTTLFTIASLSPVWIIADLQEADLARVRVGSMGTVTADAYPTLALEGKVTYIGPTLRPETRTAQVRIEAPNPAGRLRFGMFVKVTIRAPGGQATVRVPAEAVQAMGARHFVYLAAPGVAGQYVEREVTVGVRSEDGVEILRGVSAGDALVAKGSFFVRAEGERLGLRAGQKSRTPPPAAAVSKEALRVPTPIRITVGDAGFEPARVEVPRGTIVVLEFTRVSEKTCATEIVLPERQVKKALPLKTPVSVELNAGTAGEISFTCGMNMFKGVIVVR